MKLKAILLAGLLCLSGVIHAADNPVIKIETATTSLIFRVGDNGRLYQSYLGKRLHNEADIRHLPQGTEGYLTHGLEDYYEPALHIVHNDGNPSTLLKYTSHSSQKLTDGATETVITLNDDQYPITVKLHYVAYPAENIIKTFSEISHKEKKPVSLQKYASSMLHLNRNKYFLTEFSGDWSHEANVTERELAYGKKVIDTKLGARANMFVSPFFQVSLDNPSEENAGEVLVGTLGWTGNFRFTFEVDHQNHLRVISGINPYASEYSLPANEVFRTPDFYFTYSLNGKGQASRNFHDWARRYQVKAGDETRMTLLNNWEATYFDFNEDKLVTLIGEAKHLGVDMFLLDDGWFANKYPRSSDHQGLGDWTETADKLPNGIGKLTAEAKKQGVKFGIWIEPEMVNPKSELYEKHKDWVIRFPNREEYYFRNQLVLDLSNPAVQDHVFGVVDQLMTKYPDIAFFKWDCNSPITNIYSTYLKGKQTHLYIDYVRGLYKVLERVKAKYPNLPMMLCAGASEQAVSQWASTFAEKGLHIQKTVGDLVGPMMFSVLMGLSRLIYGKYGEKLNLDRFMKGSCVLCVASYLCISLVPVPIVGLIGCAICGFSVGIMWPGTFSKASAAIKRGGTVLFAMLALAGDLGCSGGPTLVGFVSSAFSGNLRLGILTAIVFPVLLLAGLCTFSRLVVKNVD